MKILHTLILCSLLGTTSAQHFDTGYMQILSDPIGHNYTFGLLNAEVS